MSLGLLWTLLRPETRPHTTEHKALLEVATGQDRSARLGIRRAPWVVELMVIPEPIPDPQNCRHVELVAIGDTEDGMCCACGVVMSTEEWDGKR